MTIFDSLINQPHSELELLRLVAEQIHATFHEQERRHYYLKLAKVDETRSKIIWVKAFSNPNDYNDFHFSFEFLQASLVAYPQTESYKVAVGGFTKVTSTEVFADHIKYSKWVFGRMKNVESHRAVPREIIAAGLADLCGQFQTKAKKAS